MTKNPTACAVIVCAGSGTRMKQIKKKDGTAVNKVFREIAGVPIVAHTVHAFEQTACIGSIVLVTRSEDIAELSALVREFEFKKVKSIVCGGATRQASVANGLAEADSEIVLIHDGARALVTPTLIERVYNGLLSGKAAGVTVAVKAKDSLKRAGADGIVKESLSREDVYNIQTPQGFYTEDIVSFHKKATAEGYAGTDDCMIAEYCGGKILLVEGDYTNIKITTEEDMDYAHFLITKEN